MNMSQFDETRRDVLIDLRRLFSTSYSYGLCNTLRKLNVVFYAIYRWRTCGKDNDSAEYHLPEKLASIH